MKYACYFGLTRLVREMGWLKTAKYLREIGFEGVEFLDGGDVPEVIRDVEEAKTVRGILNDNGLQTACFSCGVTMMRREGWGEQNPAEIAMKRYIDIAAALGSPFFHYTQLLWLEYPQNAPRYEDVFEPIVDTACRIAAYAGHYGMTCLYEEQGLYFNGVERFGRFFEAVKARRSNVGVCADMGNSFFVDESPALIFERFAKDVKHVHMKDYRVTGAKPEGMAYVTPGGRWLQDCRVGEGDAEAARCLKALKKVGYNGWFSFENTDTDFETGAACCRRTMESVFR